MIWPTSARATRRRLIRPPRYSGRPNAGIDALAMTVLSRSKNAARIMSMTDQQLLDRVLRIGGHQDQHLVADGEAGVAPGHDEVVVPDHGHHRGRPRDPEIGQRHP